MSVFLSLSVPVTPWKFLKNPDGALQLHNNNNNKTTNNLIKIRAKDLNRHFFREDKQIGNKYMKTRLTLPVIRETQIKTEMKGHLTTAGMAIIKTSAEENSMADPQKN